MQQFGHFFDHYFAIDLVLRLIELVLSFFFLGTEHDSSGVGKSLLDAVL